MRIFAFLLLFFTSLLQVHAADLLEPEQAFRFSAQQADANTLEVRYQIADGYYMYRQRFKFSLDGGTLGTPQFPAGKMHADPTFGQVETYRNEVRVKLPFTRTGNAQSVTLKAVSQGCADAGVCYTPMDSMATIRLAAADPASSQPPAGQPAGILAGLRNLGDQITGNAQPQFLPPDQAFKLSLGAVNGQTLKASFTLAPDYYLYKDKIHFTVKSPAGVSVAKVVLPAGDIEQDPNFGRLEVYHHNFSGDIILNRPAGSAGKVVVEASYQGCSEKGVCYPPISKTFTLTLPAATAAASANSAAANLEPIMPAAAPSSPATAAPPVATAAAQAPVSESSQIERVLKGGHFWTIIATFFGAGLLLSLTPCVFPMIPILSGIIAGQKQVTRLSGFMLSLAYVLGMAITYALAGVAAALSGTLISNALQNPIALSLGAAVFVLLALSMFGFFELQLPSFIQSKFSDASNKVKGGNFIGVFVMGALSALIIGPCVAPPLAAALAFIAQTGSTVLGGWALFALAIGMGVPLLLVGISAGTLLPRAGGWMNAVKYFFGVLMLAIAIWLITPLIPAWIQMLLWATLLIASAMHLKAVEPLAVNASGWQRLWKGLGIIALLAGVALIVGMLAGGREVLQPLAVFKGGAGGASAAQTELKFTRVRNLAELDTRISQSNGKFVVLDFYADWCVSCKEMEHGTFSDPKVQAALKDAVLLQADVTNNTGDDKALLKRFGLFGPPGLIFFDRNGKEVAYRVIGYQPPAQFLNSLEAALR
ncbi:thiol:disulfide interchange protein DsbD [Sulfuriferula plumbiphila]|uniref:Thiol:disulfide interchange protein DsbD n=1 Tax=Sulfuriferula plumbiphila TaxID=171865 RepID=A0A512L3H4_9PROT|nr:protein-disulfide reductase DsbD [Sulfuriferula plumbiphila]BBP02732.1 thiol:disulfide interchange protein DsbD [Sulfuriferula plumbiphila]GEP29026.1 thiol:disulfide interchange protein DsbD [Sulfuriferula plumbiphila]